MSTRRLAAIMFTDVVGYTAMMEKDEQAAMQVLSAHKHDLEELSHKYNSEVIEYFGDGSLTLFNSVHDAVACARELQERLTHDGVVPLRVGVHIGEVLKQEGKIFGDGVNVASRVESVGYAGTVLLSQQAYDKVKNQPEFQFQDIGEFNFKNVEKPMRVYALIDDSLPPFDKRNLNYEKATRISRTRTWLYTGLILLAIASVTAALMIFGGEDESPADQQVQANKLLKLAVFPFDVKGSSDMEYLKEGLVDVVSTKIDGVAGFTAVDPNMTIGYYKGQSAELNTPDQFARAAAELGAEEFILGNVIKLGEDIRLKISQYDTDGKLKTTEEVVIKSLSGLLGGIDDLIRQTVAEKFYSTGQTTTAAQAMFSSDMEALQFFLEAEEKRRIGYYEEASRLYQNALERDSTMPLAWIGLWQVCSWSFQCKLSDTEMLTSAEKYSSELPLKWREYIRLSADWRLFRPTDYEQEIRALIDRFGESTELLTLLGEVIFHGHIFKEQLATEALPYFLKAFEYDPGNVEVLNHVIQLLSYLQDDERLAEILERIPRGSVNWSVARSAYLTCREGAWTDEEVQEILDNPGFDIDPIFLRARSENTLDRFGKLFVDLEEANGSRFVEKEAPIHSLRLNWYGKDDYAMQVSQGSKFEGMLKYGLSLGYLGIELPELDSLKLRLKPQLRSGFTGGPFPDDLILALLAADFNDSEAFKTSIDKLKELSGDDGIFLKSQLTSEGYWHFKRGNHISSIELLDSALVTYGRPLNGVVNAFVTGAITMVQAENYYAIDDLDKALLYYTILMDVLEAGDDSKVGYSWLRRAEILSELNRNEEALRFLNMFLKMYKDSDPKYLPWVERASVLRNEVFARLN